MKTQIHLPAPVSEIDYSSFYLRQSIFDNPSELEFYRILSDEILGQRFLALVQFPMASLIGVHNQQEPKGYGHWQRVNKKRFDYLICHRRDLKPALVIELDGDSHVSAKRQKRDQFVETVLRVVQIPFIRIPRQRHYNKPAIALEIAKRLNLEERVIRRLEQAVKSN